MENKTGGLTLLSIWSGEKLSKDSCGFPCPPIDEFGGQAHCSETRRADEPHRYPNAGDGRRLRSQTRDRYRVNFDGKNVEPFSCLAFPFSQPTKTALEWPIFGDELVTSSLGLNQCKPHFLQRGFWHTLKYGQAIANNKAAGNTNVQDELKRLENDRAQAVLKGDTAALDQMTADDYTVINISGQLLTKAQVFEAIKSGDLKYDQLENNDIQVRVYGDTAVLTGRTTQKGQFKGKDISGQTRFTRVYLKQHGKWQAVAFQATRIAEQ
jgi:ketosteroid isomerase-like protein